MPSIFARVTGGTSERWSVLRRLLLKCFLIGGMLLGLPLLGISLAAIPVKRYLAFPPKALHIHHVPFSWPVFAVYSAVILIVVLPLILQGIRGLKRGRQKRPVARSFPWWGWVGLSTGLVTWCLAWTRFPWFRACQPHTFTPLWLSFVMVINGLHFRRNGHCLMLDHPAFFLLLFPVSGTFWWFFEYLNRFVGNWSYVIIPASGWSYFWRATPPFSTVLPAVLSTQDWFSDMHWVQKGFKEYIRIRFAHPRWWAALSLTACGFSLIGIGVWPDLLFSFLWIAPLFILVSVQTLFREPNVFSGIAGGDWRLAVSSAAAALFCGWFWEMWNEFSLAKWTYTIPFVHSFQVFEMPILGYAGYLPFGLECVAVSMILERALGIEIGRELRVFGPQGS